MVVVQGVLLLVLRGKLSVFDLRALLYSRQGEDMSMTTRFGEFLPIH